MPDGPRALARRAPLLPALALAGARGCRAEEKVDFNFMTEDLDHPGIAKGGSSDWLFSDRAVSDDVKEELVRGHVCQKKGKRDDTYFASSYCYWVPELFPPTATQRGGCMEPMDEECFPVWNKPAEWWEGKWAESDLFTWRRGDKSVGMLARVARRSFLLPHGSCVRHDICHSNGHDGFDPEAVLVSEGKRGIVELPSTCLGDRAIRDACLKEHRGGVAGEEEVEAARCRALAESHADAVQNLETCTKGLLDWPGLVSRLTEDRERVRSLRGGLADDLQKLKQNATALGSDRGETCKHHVFSSWTRKKPSNCIFGKIGNKLQTIRQCEKCRKLWEKVAAVQGQIKPAEKQLADYGRRDAALTAELESTEDELRRCTSEKERLEEAKRSMDDKWLPQKEACLATMRQFESAEKSFMARCVPSKYELSCERACLETASYAGCAVLEGLRPGSAGDGAGVQVECAPRYPSFIFSYSMLEPLGDQCRRIASAQAPRHSQRVLKAGWLLKQRRGLAASFQRRFFVLESGDQVRSAILRYFLDDPTANASAAESSDKAIIVWDAKRVKAKAGRKYGLKGGESCFKLYHFYREFRLCVPADGRSPREAAEQRDEWMRLLVAEMRFAGAVQ